MWSAVLLLVLGVSSASGERYPDMLAGSMWEEDRPPGALQQHTWNPTQGAWFCASQSVHGMTRHSPFETGCADRSEVDAVAAKIEALADARLAIKTWAGGACGGRASEVDLGEASEDELGEQEGEADLGPANQMFVPTSAHACLL